MLLPLVDDPANTDDQQKLEGWGQPPAARCVGQPVSIRTRSLAPMTRAGD